MSADENIRVIERIYRAFSRGGLDEAASLVTEDFQLDDLSSHQTFHGPEGFRQWMQGFKTAAPDARVEVTNIVASDQWIAAEHIGRFTNTGPLMTADGEVPPTGRAVEIDVAEFFQMRDGKVARLRAYHDSATVLQQLGLLPQPAPTGA